MVALSRDGYLEQLKLLTEKQRKRIKNTSYDYIILDFQCTNTMSWIDLSFSNKIPTRKLNRGDCSVFDKYAFTDLVLDYEREIGEKFYK